MWLPLDEEAALDVMAELAGSDRAAVVRVALRRVLGAHPDDIRAGIAELPPDGRRSGPRATSAHDKIVSILDAAVSPGLSEAEIAETGTINRAHVNVILRRLVKEGRAERDRGWPRRWLLVTEDG